MVQASKLGISLRIGAAPLQPTTEPGPAGLKLEA
jgi:hypothetical protein